MAQQERAVRTRRQILVAAASAFEERGYDGTSTTEILTRAGTTRGALYFHFSSKRAIANAVVEAQTEALQPPEHEIRLQSVIDVTLGFARRLQTDSVLRAAVRLAVEDTSFSRGDVTPYQWAQDAIQGLLGEGLERGELLRGTDVLELTQFIVGAFTGVQLLSHIVSERRDLLRRVSVMWGLLLPGIAHPGLITRLDWSEGRGGEPLPVQEGNGEAFRGY